MNVHITDTSISGGKFIVTYDYHLTRDKVRREMVSTQKYNYIDFFSLYFECQ